MVKDKKIGDMEQIRKQTLKEVGEWLERKLQGGACVFIYEENDFGLKALVKTLKHGEMPVDMGNRED